ncbi:MAG: response regulator [Bacillaceae bacterium]
MKIRILIVEDHVLVRKGLKLLLGEYEDEVEVIGEASDGSEAITLAIKYQPDVVLLDLSMPDGLDGFSAATAILEQVKHVHIIVLTMHDQEIYVQKALSIGIQGYLLKNVHEDELLTCIQTVMKGHMYYRTNTLLEQNQLIRDAMKESVLSERERAIVRLVVLGYTNIQIGKKLFISPKTVENHKANIMKKLQLKDKHDFVKYAIKNQFIDLIQ